MSATSPSRFRLHALAIATTVALGAWMAPPAFAGRVELSGLNAAEQHQRFIVRFHDGAAELRDSTRMQRVLDVAGRGTGGLSLRRVRHLAVGADLVSVDRPLDDAAAEMLMRQIAADPAVAYVEVDRLLKIALTPNDPRYNEQWQYLDATGGIRANLAWDSATGSGSVIAVLDTGITNHPDLNANVIAGYDFVSDAAAARDGNGRDANPNDEGDWFNAGECGSSVGSSSSWHGSHVAGSAAAVTNNATGVAGTAFNARIQPVRVLAKCGGTIADIADAIVWASGGSVAGVPVNATPAEVINLSLGGSGACSSTLQAAIDGAVSRGTALAIAAGNSNANVANFTPANCNNVIAVGSITQTGARSSFSNYGALVDVAAPGSSILSTLNSGTTTPGAASYAVYSGTSMATPHVAGVIALVQSVANPARTPAQLETLLRNTARAFPSAPSQPIGTGIVDAKAAVDAVGGGGGNVAPVAGFSVSTSGLTANFTDSSTDSDGSIASRSWNFGDGTPASSVTNPSHTYAAAGTYPVVLTVTDDDDATDTRSVTVATSNAQTYVNDTDAAIRDFATTTSAINVAGRSGNAPGNTAVAVKIVHSYIGDLRVELIAPDGSAYLLHNRTGGSTDNLDRTYTVNLSTEALNGNWTLRVRDLGFLDTGYLDRWSVTF